MTIVIYEYVMAVNPAQGDQIVPKDSPEDQDAKIQNLEREVDLLKTSIKRLLMDIRERMNEMENPFIVASVPGGRGYAPELKRFQKGNGEPKNTRLNGEEAARNSHEAQINTLMEKAEQQKLEPEKTTSPVPPSTSGYANQSLPPHVGIDRRIIDDQLVAQFKAQATGVRTGSPNPLPVYGEKFRLQKVYKLFEWTRQAVRKYGHDRLEIILQSYKTMGYISKDSFEEIREVAKLMPASLGEEHEVGPDEYVSELYMLNRIIAPEDISLDRDMIELMMEQRSQKGPSVTPSPVMQVEFPTMLAKEKKPAKNKEMEEDWMNLPDRI
jgi:hypothetical protein